MKCWCCCIDNVPNSLLMKRTTDIFVDNLSMFDVIKRAVNKNIKGVYGSASFDDDGRLLSFNEQVAIVTHYMLLKDSEHFGDKYANKGKEILQLWYEFLMGEKEEIMSGRVVSEDVFYGSFFNNVTLAPFHAQKNPTFRFIDLFAGIGGFRIAMQDCGGECVYSSEWDENAQKTYYHNFGEVPFGDITQESNKRLSMMER